MVSPRTRRPSTSPGRMDLSAVVINYKSRDALAECLEALLADARASGLAL